MAVRRVRERLGAEVIDRLWIFPPMKRGRQEWGVIAASCLVEDGDRRALYTLRYSAEVTGSGTEFESELTPEGEAPPDRLPRVMEGVVRRSEDQLGNPRVVEIGGQAEVFNQVLEEYDSSNEGLDR
jgi:hypothetical protein